MAACWAARVAAAVAAYHSVAVYMACISLVVFGFEWCRSLNVKSVKASNNPWQHGKTHAVAAAQQQRQLVAAARKKQNQTKPNQTEVNSINVKFSTMNLHDIALHEGVVDGLLP